MSIPYQSNANARAAVVAIDASINKPFSQRMDNATTEYIITCSCKRENYTSIPFTRVMDSAANAGLLELPFAANANAYFLGDDNFEPGEGDLITFTRTFGTKPLDITLMESDYNYGFPAFRAWRVNSSQSSRQRFFSNNGNELPPRLGRQPFNRTVTGRYEYKYYISTANGTDINPDTTFMITSSGSTTAYPAGTAGTYYIDIPSSSKLNFVANSASGGITWPGTTPSLSTYQYYISNKLFLTAESAVRHYKGNIFEKRTVKVIAI